MMGTTTPLGYPYPEPSDTPDVPRDIKALAEAIQSDFMGRLIQAGQVAVPIANGQTDGQKTVTFPKQFPGTPIVVVQGSNRGILSRSTQASATGFSAQVRARSGPVPSATQEYVRWIAVWLGADNPTNDMSDEPPTWDLPDEVVINA